jgi:hypothetical protein
MRTGLWLCGVVLVGAHAHAMSMRSDEREVARSDDGQARLVAVVEDGPEGGSRRSFEVRAGDQAARFTYSNTLSRGAGASTEYVERAACEAALKGLQARLKQGWGKAGLSVHVEACAQPGRPAAVEVTRP